MSQLTPGCDSPLKSVPRALEHTVDGHNEAPVLTFSKRLSEGEPENLPLLPTGPQLKKRTFCSAL